MKSIKTKMILLFTLIIFIGMAALSFAGYYFARESLTGEVEKALVNISYEVSKTIAQRIEHRLTLLSTVSMDEKVRDAGTPMAEKVEIVKRKMGDTDFKTVGITLENGDLYLNNGKVINVSDRDYFKKALSGQRVVTEPLISRDDGSIVVVYAVPLKDLSGRISGAVIGTVDAKKLSDIISDVKYGETGYGIIFSGDGTIIAHKDFQRVQNRENYIEMAKTKPEYAELAGIIQRAVSEKSMGFGKYTFEGQKKYLGYCYMPDTGWIIGVNVLESEILGSVGILRKTLLFISAIFLILAALITYFVSRSISNPIIEIVQYIKNLSGGDYSRKLPERFLRYKDEIGELSHAVEILRENVCIVVKNMKENASRLLNSSESLSAAAEEIAASSAEVAKTIQEVSVGTTNQASDSQEIVALIKNITDNIDNVYRKLKAVKESSENAQEKTDEGKNVLDGLIRSIENIRKAFEEVTSRVKNLISSVSQVGEINEIINGIAEQTNLLALNAAIEAARAGEVGRGFAVVASEIRKLAEETKSSSVRIKKLINDIGKETEEVSSTSGRVYDMLNSQVSAVKDTLTSFDNILSSISNIAPLINDTYFALDETVKSKDTVLSKAESITSVVEEISASAEEVSASAQELSASTEEIAATAQNLTDIAREMTESVNKFKVE